MANSAELAVELNPPGTVQTSILWLHGLGADGHDFLDIVPELKLPESMGVRFVFPHAPFQPVTINGGMVMRAWYDIYGLEHGAGEDEAGIRRSGASLQALIDREMARGIASQRIILAGFSQGGAIALHAGLRCPVPLGGIVALSTYLPLAASLTQERHTANQRIPILMTHGDEDDIIPLPTAQRSHDLLVSLGYHIDWRVYPMAHTMCLEEVHNIGAWLTTICKKI